MTSTDLACFFCGGGPVDVEMRMWTAFGGVDVYAAHGECLLACLHPGSTELGYVRSLILSPVDPSDPWLPEGRSAGQVYGFDLGHGPYSGLSRA